MQSCVWLWSGGSACCVNALSSVPWLCTVTALVLRALHTGRRGDVHNQYTVQTLRTYIDLYTFVFLFHGKENGQTTLAYGVVSARKLSRKQDTVHYDCRDIYWTFRGIEFYQQSIKQTIILLNTRNVYNKNSRTLTWNLTTSTIANSIGAGDNLFLLFQFFY